MKLRVKNLCSKMINYKSTNKIKKTYISFMSEPTISTKIKFLRPKSNYNQGKFHFFNNYKISKKINYLSNKTHKM